MSATGDFLIELTDYVWLIEFAGLSFEQRGKAQDVLHGYLEAKFGNNISGNDFCAWFDSAYDLALEHGGADWATGKHAERLLSWVA
jgi:hypothetical protein